MVRALRYILLQHAAAQQVEPHGEAAEERAAEGAAAGAGAPGGELARWRARVARPRRGRQLAEELEARGWAARRGLCGAATALAAREEARQLLSSYATAALERPAASRVAPSLPPPHQRVCGASRDSAAMPHSLRSFAGMRGAVWRSLEATTRGDRHMVLRPAPQLPALSRAMRALRDLRRALAAAGALRGALGAAEAEADVTYQLGLFEKGARLQNHLDECSHCGGLDAGMAACDEPLCWCLPPSVAPSACPRRCTALDACAARPRCTPDQVP